MRRWLSLAASALLGCPLAGCGAGPSSSCSVINVLHLVPLQATVDSAAKAPGNQQIFTSSESETATGPGLGCGVPALAALIYPLWTNPDPIHITISSAKDATNGTAICKGPTAGAVTLTATTGIGSQAVSSTAQLTCR